MPRTKQFDEQAVLERAVDLFWKQGYHSTSMQNLVDHLGINRASMYTTFGDKKQLFLRAIQHYRKVNSEGIANLLADEPDVRLGLRRILELAVTEAAADAERKGCFVVNTTTELIPNDPEVLPIVAENKEQIEQSIYNYLLQGQQSGQIAPEVDVQVIASLIFTTYNGLRVVGKIDPESATLPRTVEAVLSLLG
ncbi:MAG: TetR/AcrR family transcriptional regulator [Bacteroidota bacterium]